MDNDAALVLQAQQGDTDAFGKLLDRHADTVYAIAYGYAGNVADARDLVQEIFIKTFRTLKDLREPQHFKNWLFRIAKSKSLDWLDKTNPTSYADPITFDRMPCERGVNSRTSSVPPARVEAREIDVTRILESLPDEHRIVLSLRYIRDMNYDQIAETLDISVTEVSNRLVRAKRYVRKHLDKRT